MATTTGTSADAAEAVNAFLSAPQVEEPMEVEEARDAGKEDAILGEEAALDELDFLKILDVFKKPGMEIVDLTTKATNSTVDLSSGPPSDYEYEYEYDSDMPLPLEVEVHLGEVDEDEEEDES